MKNWTIKEAVAAVKAGTDVEAIKEIARINPLFVLAVAKDDVVAIANMMGEKFTVRRLEDGSAAVADSDTDEVVASDEAVTNDVVESNGAVEETESDANYEGMSTKELMKLCDKRGIKVPHYGKNKKFYIDALTNASNTTVEAAEETEVEEAEAPAHKKSAAKKPAKKAPAVEEDGEEDEDGDWGDAEEAEEETPKAETKKSAPKKAAEAEEDDDDWDL